MPEMEGFSRCPSRVRRSRSESRLVLTSMNGPQEYEVGQCFLRSFRNHADLNFSSAESVTRARVQDKKGKKITWVRAGCIGHLACTKWICAEILRQGSFRVVVSFVAHLPQSRRSGKGMIGMKARMLFPRTDWGTDRFDRAQLGTYRFISRRL